MTMGNKAKIREKKHRLPLEVYRGQLIVTYTANLKFGDSLLTDEKIFENLVIDLERGMVENLCKCIFTFMPDHIHIIVLGESEDSDAYHAMLKFKQYSGFWFSENSPDMKWQKDFYDHVHGDDEDMYNQILYLLNNPVRKGLVQKWWEYPYSGSVGFDWDKIVTRFSLPLDP